MFHEEWMKKTQLWISFASFQKNFFSKFELLNSGCSLSAGVYGNLIASVGHYLPVTFFSDSLDSNQTGFWKMVGGAVLVRICTSCFYFATKILSRARDYR